MFSKDSISPANQIVTTQKIIFWNQLILDSVAAGKVLLLNNRAKILKN